MRINHRNKYGAKRCEYDGHKFDSQGERDYYKHLLTKYDKEDIVVHPPKVSLIPTMSWKLDFYIASEDRYIDFKGVETASYKEKLKVWKSFGPTILTAVYETPIIDYYDEDYGPGLYKWVKITSK